VGKKPGSREAAKPRKSQVEARNSDVHHEETALTRSLQNVEL
jgi:hypothetical protein